MPRILTEPAFWLGASLGLVLCLSLASFLPPPQHQQQQHSRERRDIRTASAEKQSAEDVEATPPVNKLWPLEDQLELALEDELDLELALAAASASGGSRRRHRGDKKRGGVLNSVHVEILATHSVAVEEALKMTWLSAQGLSYHVNKQGGDLYNNAATLKQM